MAKLLPSRLLYVMEISAYLVIVLLAIPLAQAGVLGLGGCIVMTVCLLTMLLFLSWYHFDGGRHPCFLFLATLLLFQGGRLLGYVFGITRYPLMIEVEAPTPVSVSHNSAFLTLFILAISAICIYAPCVFTYKRVVFGPGAEQRWLPGLYWTIGITAPFSFYKNLMYLTYIRSHGGYLVVYTDNAGVLQSAGVIARVLALINVTAILTAYVFERRRPKLRLLLVLFFVLSTLDLLIGFRGKFFTQMLGLIFIHYVKTGKRFKLPQLALSVGVVSLLAVLIAGFRENRTATLLNPMSFVAQQGVSLNVTEAAVEFHDLFGRYGAGYIFGGFMNGFSPQRLQRGDDWSADLSTFLNPQASEMGFGTASSYLAELYLLGRLPAIIIGSFVIGCCCSILHRSSKTTAGAIILMFVLPSLIYLPRLELLNPVASLIKNLVALVPVALLVVIYNAGNWFLRHTFTAPMSRLEEDC